MHREEASFTNSYFYGGAENHSTQHSSEATLSPIPAWADALATKEDIQLLVNEQKAFMEVSLKDCVAVIVNECAKSRDLDSVTSRLSIVESEVSTLSSEFKDKCSSTVEISEPEGIDLMSRPDVLRKGMKLRSGKIKSRTNLT